MSISVAVLGSGNMAFHLLSAFTDARVNLAGLISRDLNKGMELLDDTGANCELIGGTHLQDLDADAVILAVPEGALQKVQRFYDFNPDHLVVHTSGAEPMDSLRLERVGVFYPIQTLTSGEKIDFREVPILVEASNASGEELLLELGQRISNNVRKVPSEDRLVIHLAAVLANNFSNHLFSKAQDLLEKHGYSLDILFPMIDESVRKMKSIGPKNAQTGPARRGDLITIEKHLDILTEEKVRQIYQLLTDDIRRTYES